MMFCILIIFTGETKNVLSHPQDCTIIYILAIQHVIFSKITTFKDYFIKNTLRNTIVIKVHHNQTYVYIFYYNYTLIMQDIKFSLITIFKDYHTK